MNAQRSILLAALAGALLLAVGLLVVRTAGEERAAAAWSFGVEAARIPDVPAEPDVERPADSDEGAQAARAVAAGAAHGAPGSKPAPSARGRVLDLGGQPVPGVPVARRHDPGEPFATTDAEGTFALPAHVGELAVADPRWFTLRDTERLERDGSAEALVVVAPAIRVAGVVQDPEARALPGARVGLEIPAVTFGAFPFPLDRARGARTAEVESGSDGAFELVIPDAPEVAIEARLDGHARASIAAPRAPRRDLVLVLRPVDDGGALRVRGTVVHGVGTAAVGALVRYRGNATRSDDRGAFELVVKDWSEPGPLVAVLSGFQAAIGPDVSTLGRMGAPDPQRLVLGPPPLAIAGRVVDHEGRPQAGWTVQPVDPVVLEEGRIPPECVEELTLGAPLGARTDADGAFELLGLQDRAYRLQAHSAKALVRVESEPIPAGARNVRVLVPADARFARIDGVVVGLDGTPVAGVGVRPTLIVLRTQSGYTMEHADGVTTDAEGRFALVDVPRQSSRLDVDGDAILPASHALDDHQDGTSIRIQVARRKHLRVEGIPPESGVRWVSVLDGSDQELQLMQFQSGGWASSTRVLVQGGAIPVVSVAESARTIVFSLEHPNEVRRPITLAREGITTVRW